MDYGNTNELIDLRFYKNISEPSIWSKFKKKIVLVNCGNAMVGSDFH